MLQAGHLPKCLCRGGDSKESDAANIPYARHWHWHCTDAFVAAAAVCQLDFCSNMPARVMCSTLVAALAHPCAYLSTWQICLA
jgi:hypothetical protein